MSDLWPRIEPLLASVERPARYIDREWGALHPIDPDYRVALVYPDAYELGMANQALSILYERLAAIPGVAPERAFVPWRDMAEQLRGNDVPLFTLESCTPVGEVDLLGITLPYEMTYSNILEILDLAGIPLRSDDRSDSDPLVFGGGPCAFNPEPVAPFFDAILIGDGEEAIAEIVATHRAGRAAGASRSAILAALAGVSGVYVPSMYDMTSGVAVGRDGAPDRVTKRVLADLDSVRPPVSPIVPFMDVVHDRMTIEVLRGCSRGCRFCQAGMVYRPVRERSSDNIVRDVLAGLWCSGHEEVSLTSLSTADHSQLEDILRRLSRRLEGSGISVSLPSLRVDAFSVDMARMLGGGRKTGLTFAPEAGTQRLRDVINKNVTEEQLLATVHKAFSAGWHRIKLYFMIGLPTETDEDVRGIGALVQKVLDTARESVEPAKRGGIRISVSVSTFVPKSHTPFQWDAQVTPEEVRRRQEVLRGSMPKRGVDLSWHASGVSFLEGVFARGGRELADVIEHAWRAGARYDAWTEEFDLGRWISALEACGVDPSRIASRERDTGEPLPWGHIDVGLSVAYLRIERERAREAITTPDCTFDECTGCGVCPTLGVDVILGGGGRE
ncbi:MAG: TIGR03960 family B12-binding radical SAM protein [Coriobacteriia bacterium]|nr:TIGR03960 family B12-binding radical SAM protein [Coriobacteriia bacterium]